MNCSAKPNRMNNSDVLMALKNELSFSFQEIQLQQLKLTNDGVF